MFASEYEGLQALRAAGARAPEPYSHGIRKGRAFIEMEQLQLGAAPDWDAMGRMLAALHRTTGEQYGWARDNWIGLSPQKNAWRRDWVEFYRDFRLLPQLERAGLVSEARPLLDRLESFFRDSPAPSLLHGDLWSGNAGFTPQGPVIFDPAVYYGDREADLAMTELFGGFPREFYKAYEKEWPLDRGYSRRKDLYKLYHLLNHLNLFGGGYLAQVKETLSLLLRA